jgi:hypothetical protein
MPRGTIARRRLDRLTNSSGEKERDREEDRQRTKQ